MDPIKQLINVPPPGTAPITADEIASLCRCRNPKEWNAIVAAIEAGRGGHYPPDWYEAVMRSGLHYELTALWAIRDGVLARLASEKS